MDEDFRIPYLNVYWTQLGLFDKQTDGLRFYNLGNNYKNKVEHTGAKTAYDMKRSLVL